MQSTVDHSVAVSIQNVSKTYHQADKDVQAIRNVSLNIYKNEFIAVIGPSGCGKTTLLRLIAGFETDYEGSIRLNDRRVEGPGLDRGIIFQEHRLLPWLTIGENVGLGLEGGKDFIRQKVRRYLEKVNLGDFINAYPSQLSGGMSQRAAIARALICQPEILLLDEPLGALDALTRVHMQAEIEKIWLTEKTTMFLITHDIEEAIYLGSRVVVLSARPTEINAIINVDLARPRERTSPEFTDIKKQVIQALNESIGTYSI